MGKPPNSVSLGYCNDTTDFSTNQQVVVILLIFEEMLKILCCGLTNTAEIFFLTKTRVGCYNIRGID